MATTRTRGKTDGVRAELGAALRALAPSAQATLSLSQLRPLLPSADAATVAALVAGLAYEHRCNYRMVADQAVFSKRPADGT